MSASFTSPSVELPRAQSTSHDLTFQLTGCPIPFSADQYELLDYGDGRKLERIGNLLVDRPSPGCEEVQRARSADWQAAIRFHRETAARGTWSEPQEPWRITCGRSVFELRTTDSGQVGLFPEQADNWDWLTRAIAAASAPGELQVLNLFAYTGGSTMAVAAAGANVVHVDAAEPAVRWARHNAELSGLASQPIRWICEDARRFVARELRRGRQYDGIILDPPSYGHGPKAEPWKIDEHLPSLVEDCVRLAGGRPRFFLLSCHAPHWEADELAKLLRDAIGGPIEAAELTLATRDGRRLNAGATARYATR